MDPKGVGRVSFAAFCDVARSMGFGELRQLWCALDTNRSGFLTLEKWDRLWQVLVSRTPILAQVFGSRMRVSRPGCHDVWPIAHSYLHSFWAVSHLELSGFV